MAHACLKNRLGRGSWERFRHDANPDHRRSSRNLDGSPENSSRRADYSYVREPLILPLASIAAGILAGRMFAFSTHESAWPIAAFLILAIVARGRNRFLLWASMACALLFVGIFVEAWHRPGPPPVIEAGARETIILAGCVVEPTCVL